MCHYLTKYIYICIDINAHLAVLVRSQSQSVLKLDATDDLFESIKSTKVHFKHSYLCGC